MSLDDSMIGSARCYCTPPARQNQESYNYRKVLIRKRGNEHTPKLWNESPSYDVYKSRRTRQICKNASLVQRRQFLMPKRVPFLKMRLPSNHDKSFDDLFTLSQEARQERTTRGEQCDCNTLPPLEKNLDDTGPNHKRAIEEFLKGKNASGDCDFFLDNPRKLIMNVEKKYSIHCDREAIISTSGDGDGFILDYPSRTHLGVDAGKRKSSFISMRPRKSCVVY